MSRLLCWSQSLESRRRVLVCGHCATPIGDVHAHLHLARGHSRQRVKQRRSGGGRSGRPHQGEKDGVCGVGGETDGGCQSTFDPTSSTVACWCDCWHADSPPASADGAARCSQAYCSTKCRALDAPAHRLLCEAGERAGSPLRAFLHCARHENESLLLGAQWLCRSLAKVAREQIGLRLGLGLGLGLEKIGREQRSPPKQIGREVEDLMRGTDGANSCGGSTQQAAAAAARQIRAACTGDAWWGGGEGGGRVGSDAESAVRQQANDAWTLLTLALRDRLELALERNRLPSSWMSDYSPLLNFELWGLMLGTIQRR